MAVATPQLLTVRMPNNGRTRECLAGDEAFYAGTLAFNDSSGYLTNTAGGNPLAGVVRYSVDNSGGSNGDKKVELYTEGDFVLPLASVAQGDVDELAYASDNYTLTKTATSNSFVGSILRVAGTNLAEVRIDIQRRPDAIE